MKRIISFVLCLGVLLAIPTACQAVEKEFGPDRMVVTKTSVRGKLYKYQGSNYVANASTTSVSGRKGVEVALYPTEIGRAHV